MKLMIKLFIFLVLLLVVGPYLLMGPEGMSKFMRATELVGSKMDFSLPSFGGSDVEIVEPNGSGQQLIKWSKDSLEKGPEKLDKDQLALMGELEAQKNIFYRWQDENGVWQFSQIPNPNTVNFVVRTDPDANLLQGLSEDQIDIALGRFKPETSNSITDNNPLAKGEDLESALPLPATIPLEEIPKLIEQAKDVQNIVNQRKEAMDARLNGQSR